MMVGVKCEIDAGRSTNVLPRHTDRGTDRQTDRQANSSLYIRPPLKLRIMYVVQTIL